jgi:hypothetical protein
MNINDNLVFFFFFFFSLITVSVINVRIKYLWLIEACSNAYKL